MGNAIEIPSTPGTYVLILELKQDLRIGIGKLGEQVYPAGCYAYVGSAQGSGGLAGRIGRHLRTSDQKRSHWHIDALNSQAEIVQVWWKEGSPSQECYWALCIAADGTRSIPGFGSTDCRCPSHLFHFKNYQELTTLLVSMKRRHNIQAYSINIPSTITF
jgi:Uri superfamily endonuclease